ncbi:MAG TPA: hypothetical protein P5556_09265 [Candidatus Gastranaerophilales bacterium]|nr:hypothetical protein [Candidatus Gastranaerophilales bacterium]
MQISNQQKPAFSGTLIAGPYVKKTVRESVKDLIEKKVPEIIKNETPPSSSTLIRNLKNTLEITQADAKVKAETQKMPLDVTPEKFVQALKAYTKSFNSGN